ncbi:hypothetical protein Hypma_000074, partial [Hypsizygus marmoreus]
MNDLASRTPGLAERLYMLRHAMASQNHEIHKTNEVMRQSVPRNNLRGPGQPGPRSPPTTINPELCNRKARKAQRVTADPPQQGPTAQAPLRISHVEITTRPPRQRRSPAPSSSPPHPSSPLSSPAPELTSVS